MPRLLPSAFSMLLILMPPLAWAAPACIPPEEALHHVHKDVCIAVHIYRVVDQSDGTHFLDVCSPQTSDADCDFFILSFGQDAKAVGDLRALINQTIQIRGTVHTIQGRADIVLSSKAQLHGGKEKFRPNPQLVKSFSAENGGEAFRAKNGTMGQHGVHFHHRGN